MLILKLIFHVNYDLNLNTFKFFFIVQEMFLF